jgi:uncharacterized protein
MTIDTGEKNLSELLSQLSPDLVEGEFVFCTTVNQTPADLSRFSPIAMFQEAEGVTLVLDREAAEREGFSYAGVMRLITLTVHSSLDAVGLTAAVSGALAEVGISANVIAAYYHDHIFVPADRAEDALAVLKSLGAAQ